MTEEKKLVQLIQNIAKDTFWQICDEQLLPVLKDYVNIQLENSQNSSVHEAETILNMLKGLAKTNHANKEPSPRRKCSTCLHGKLKKEVAWEPMRHATAAKTSGMNGNMLLTF